MNKVPKGYKQTEVGVIPEEWEIFELNDVANIIDSLHQTPKFSENGYAMVRVTDIKPGKLQLYNSCKVSEKIYYEFIKNYMPKKGDIVMSRVGSYGVASLVDTEEPFCMGQNTVIIDPLINNGYLYYILSSSRTRIQIDYGSFGSGYKSLSLKNIKELKISCPKLKAEQSAIAEALSDVDALIFSLDELIVKKRNIKQGAMQELLTGKRRLPGFGGKWEEKRMGDCFNFSGGYSASREQLSQEGYCYLHYGDIHGSSKTFIDVDEEYSAIPKLKIDLKKISKKSFLCEGDIVFVDASEDDEGASRHIVIFNSNAIPYISGLHTIVSKSKNNLIDNNYKRYCFQSDYVKSQFKFYAAGTKVTGISKTNIAKIFINLPPTLEEQSAIAAVLSDMDAEIEQLEEKRDKYKQVKQGMMQELLTGKTRLI